MASTPGDLRYAAGDAALEPGWPSATRLVDEVLVPVARDLDLPLALKLGCVRRLAPDLAPCGGGDGLRRVDLRPLARLLTAQPRLKVLATLLGRADQHEACVLAQKFPNLHLYGCWWYCNNPSIIRELTSMRLEMLGTAFTAQHSDCRVLDQLVYKWRHSRAVIFLASNDASVKARAKREFADSELIYADWGATTRATPPSATPTSHRSRRRRSGRSRACSSRAASGSRTRSASSCSTIFYRCKCFCFWGLSFGRSENTVSVRLKARL